MEMRQFFLLIPPLLSPIRGAHIRSKVTGDTKGWVQVPMGFQVPLDGRKLELKKVEVTYATGWKTIFDAIQVYMEQTKFLDKDDFGLSNDKETTVQFDVPGSWQIKQGISISLLITIPSGTDEHGRWATISSVGAYLSYV
ncbi:hypothetical protein GGI35DRAFT_439819 [Trichoderma velutinum]